MTPCWLLRWLTIYSLLKQKLIPQSLDYMSLNHKDVLSNDNVSLHIQVNYTFKFSPSVGVYFIFTNGISNVCRHISIKSLLEYKVYSYIQSIQEIKSLMCLPSLLKFWIICSQRIGPLFVLVASVKSKQIIITKKNFLQYFLWRRPVSDEC